MNKKILLLTISALMVFNFTACNKKDETNTTNNTTGTETQIDNDNKSNNGEDISLISDVNERNGSSIIYSDDKFVLYSDGKNNYTDDIENYARVMSNDVPQQYRKFRTILNHDISYRPSTYSITKGKYASWNELNLINNGITEMEIQIEDYYIRTMAFKKNHPNYMSNKSVERSTYEYDEDTKKRYILDWITTKYSEEEVSIPQEKGTYIEFISLEDMVTNEEKQYWSDIYTQKDTNKVIEAFYGVQLESTSNMQSSFEENENYWYIKLNNVKAWNYDSKAFFEAIYDKNKDVLIYLVNSMPIETYNYYMSVGNDADFSFSQAVDEVMDVTRIYHINQEE